MYISIDYSLESNLSAVLNENTSLVMPCKYIIILTIQLLYESISLNILATTTELTSSVQTVGTPLVTLSQVSPTITLLPTTNQATPISSLVTISPESSSVGMFKIGLFVWCYSEMCLYIGPSIAAIALSSVIALVVVIFIAIFIGLLYCKRKR